MTFSLVHIALTAVVCAIVAGAILSGRAGAARADGERVRAIVALAIGLGLVVITWREVSNLGHFNDDFAPAISVSDVGSGVIPWLLLLGLTRAMPTAHFGPGSRRGATTSAWLVTATLVALALFVCNVALI